VNPGGERVLVAFNNATSSVHFAVDWHGLSFDYRLPPKATVTFRWR
jgi:O-glycosyl hydrolase